MAGFTSNVTSGTAPLTVQFNDTSTNSPTSWLWDFGDGNITNSTVQDPVHTFTSPGIYPVNLTVSNGAGSNFLNRTSFITVILGGSGIPTARFTGTPTNGTAPLDVNFTDTSDVLNGTLWNWSFGDSHWYNATATSSPIHLYNATGTYTVSLTVTNATGNNTMTRAGYITVTSGVSGSAPAVSFTADVTSGTVPFAVQFTDTSTGSPVNWTWNFGDGTSSAAQNPVHTFVQPQVFNVTLTAANSAGLTNSSMTQVTGYTPQVNTTMAINGTSTSTVNGTPVLMVNATALEGTGGSVTTTNTTATITGGNAFWQSTEVYAENVTYENTTVTVTNVTQVVLQSNPVTATLNQSVGNVSVSLDVALSQYVPDATANITITQGATTNTTHAFQLAAQNSSLNSNMSVAYTVQFTGTEAINNNLTQNTTRKSQAVILTMSVSHAWVHQFANSTNNDGRGSIAIIRYPETGDPKVLTTRWIAPTDTNGLDWFEADSPNGLSIFGMIGFAAQEAAAAPAANTGSSSSNSRSNGGSGSGSTANSAPVVASQNAQPGSPAVLRATAPLKTDKSGLLTAEVLVQSNDQIALLTLPQGIQATDKSGQSLAEVSIQPMDSSTVPSPETGSQYTFSDLAYQCGPDGARFSPAITITFTLSQNQWDTLNANGREPVIREYSTSTNTWETLPTETDPATRSVSAPVAHFSDIAIFSEPVQNRGTSAATPAPTTAQKTAAPPSNAFEVVISLGSWGFGILVKNLVLTVICIILIGIGYAGWARYRRKKQRDFLLYGKR